MIFLDQNLAIFIDQNVLILLVNNIYVEREGENIWIFWDFRTKNWAWILDIIQKSLWILSIFIMWFFVLNIKLRHLFTNYIYSFFCLKNCSNTPNPGSNIVICNPGGEIKFKTTMLGSSLYYYSDAYTINTSEGSYKNYWSRSRCSSTKSTWKK